MSTMTSQLLDELSRAGSLHEGCRRAQLITTLRMSAELRMRRGGMVLTVRTGSRSMARYLRNEIPALYRIPAVVDVLDGSDAAARFEVRVEDGAAALARAAGLIDRNGRETLGLPITVFGGSPTEIAAVWRGAVLSSGRASGPGKRSAITVSCPTPEIAWILVSCANRLGVNALVREIGGTDAVVVRDPNSILTLLHRMGAEDSVAEWNRQTIRLQMSSWGTLTAANARRTADAAAEKCAQTRRALALLEGTDAPANLLDTGRLRVAYPDASLEELGRYANPPMSKDAVAGRLRRLLALADTIDTGTDPAVAPGAMSQVLV